jgi:ADP-ribose diphosphatase
MIYILSVILWDLNRFEELLQQKDFHEARSVAALYMIRDKCRQKGII